MSGGGKKVRKTVLAFEFLIAVRKVWGGGWGGSGQSFLHSTNLLEAGTELGWASHKWLWEEKESVTSGGL